MALYDHTQQHGPLVAPFGAYRPRNRALSVLFGIGTAFADIGTIAAMSLLAALAYVAISGGSVDLARSQESAAVMSALYVTWSARDGNYASRALAAWNPFRIATKWLLSVAVFLVAAFLFKSGAYYSRGAMLCFIPLGLAGLSANRYLVARIVRQAVAQGSLRPARLAVVAVAEDDEVALHARLAADDAIRVSEIVRLRSDDEDLSSVRHVVALSRAGLIDEILIAIPWTRLRQIEQVVALLRAQALPVHVLPDLQDIGYTSRPSQLGDIPVFELKRAALSSSDLLMKRTLDVLIASAALVVLCPLLLVTALVIKLESPGPVFFRQRRHGFNNREFRIFKFRSMTVSEDGPTVTQATRHDCRVTGVGRFIRKTSIDELPQLLNVLRGEMSIVGPRPHAVAHNEEWATLVENYAQRHNILPGITGLAQVNGLRGEADTPEKISQRVKFDLAYIERWSLALDLKIVAKTALVVLFQKTAY